MNKYHILEIIITFIHISSTNWTKAVSTVLIYLCLKPVASLPCPCLRRKPCISGSCMEPPSLLAGSSDGYIALATTKHTLLHHRYTVPYYDFIKLCVFDMPASVHVHQYTIHVVLSRTCISTHSISADGSMQDVDPHLTLLCSKERRRWLPTRKKFTDTPCGLPSLSE